jgi:hypothetical protein
VSWIRLGTKNLRILSKKPNHEKYIEMGRNNFGLIGFSVLAGLVLYPIGMKKTQLVCLFKKE